MTDATHHDPDHAHLPLPPGSPPQAADVNLHQQHPIKTYLVVWISLFVLSAFSYLVDFFQVQGYLRWTLILLFMMLKAGLIVAVFMHMAWERPALTYAILLPPIAVLIFTLMMVFESENTLWSRMTYFSPVN